jgi:aryl-alcohol dehydrogenase-like predicted oxidoreductase
MKRTSLGNTNIQMSRLGLGASHLSLPKGADINSINEFLATLVKSGVNFIDTADSYGWRSCDANLGENEIAKALRDLKADHDIVVGTKGGFTHHEGHWSLNGNPDRLFAAIQKSFVAFGAERPLRLWQLHAVDPDYRISISLRAAARAQLAGLVEHVGICNVNNEQLREALTIVEIASVQNQSSPWFQQPDEEEVLLTCQKQRITFLAHTPLGGEHAHRVIHGLSLLKRMAAKHDTSVYCLLIAWLMSKASFVVPLVGTRDPSHLIANRAGADLRLPSEDISEISQLFARVRQRIATSNSQMHRFPQ